MSSLEITEKKDSIAFRVYVQPKSKKNMFAGLFENALKIKIAARPADGAANAMLIKFLSKSLKIPKSSITITSGHTSRNKRLAISLEDSDKASVKSLLESFAAK